MRTIYLNLQLLALAHGPRFGWCAFPTVVAVLQPFQLGLNSSRTGFWGLRSLGRLVWLEQLDFGTHSITCLTTSSCVWSKFEFQHGKISRFRPYGPESLNLSEDAQVELVMISAPGGVHSCRPHPGSIG